MPQDLPPGYGWSRTPPAPPEPPPREYGPPESYRTRAYLALAVAAVAIGAVVVGAREAVRRIPPDAEARARTRGDSIKAARDSDVARRRRDRTERGGGPGAPGGEDVPRMR